MARWTAKVKAAEARAVEAEKGHNATLLLAALAKADAREAREIAHAAISLARQLVNAGEARMAPGVYFLLDKGGTIVYVGQSENVLARMAGHVDKQFRTVRMVEVPRLSDRLDLERRLIQFLLPPLNVQGLQYNWPQEVLQRTAEFPQKPNLPLEAPARISQFFAE